MLMLADIVKKAETVTVLLLDVSKNDQSRSFEPYGGELVTAFLHVWQKKWHKQLN